MNTPVTSSRGFTLIETLVAVSLLTVAVVAPMTLTQQSLSSAYYARDQITAYNLAQEGIESVRAARDGQILQIATAADGSVDLFGPIPVDTDFYINGTESNALLAIDECDGVCPPLQLSEDGSLYTYGPGLVETKFVRTMRASYVSPESNDEIQLSSTVTWELDSGQTRSFTIYENVYRWINDGSAAI